MTRAMVSMNKSGLEKNSSDMVCLQIFHIKAWVKNKGLLSTYTPVVGFYFEIVKVLSLN